MVANKTVQNIAPPWMVAIKPDRNYAPASMCSAFPAEYSHLDNLNNQISDRPISHVSQNGIMPHATLFLPFSFGKVWDWCQAQGKRCEFPLWRSQALTPFCFVWICLNSLLPITKTSYSTIKHVFAHVGHRSVKYMCRFFYWPLFSFHERRLVCHIFHAANFFRGDENGQLSRIDELRTGRPPFLCK